MTYPPMKWFDNEFLPANPPPAALAAVRAGLPKLSDGTTCTKAQRIAMGIDVAPEAKIDAIRVK
jgi:hypothetical protein